MGKFSWAAGKAMWSSRLHGGFSTWIRMFSYKIIGSNFRNCWWEKTLTGKGGSTFFSSTSCVHIEQNVDISWMGEMSDSQQIIFIQKTVLETKTFVWHEQHDVTWATWLILVCKQMMCHNYAMITQCYRRLRPHSLYSMVDESSDELDVRQEKKNCQFTFFPSGML